MIAFFILFYLYLRINLLKMDYFMPKKGHKVAKIITKKNKKKEYEQAESNSVNIHSRSFTIAS